MVLGHSLTMAVHPWTGQFVYVARSDNGPGSSKLLRAHQSPVPDFFLNLWPSPGLYRSALNTVPLVFYNNIIVSFVVLDKQVCSFSHMSN